MTKSTQSKFNIPEQAPLPKDDRQNFHEQMLLGAILESNGKILQAYESRITRELFEHEGHAMVFDAMWLLHDRGMPWNPLRIIQSLDTQLDNVTNLLQSLIAMGKFFQQADLGGVTDILEALEQSLTLRNIYTQFSSLFSDYTADFDESLLAFQDYVGSIQLPGQKSEHRRESDAAVARTIETMERRNKGEADTLPIPTHLDTVNQAWAGGSYAPSYQLLAGRPSMGKTSYALQKLRAAARNSLRVAEQTNTNPRHGIMYSLETNEEQLIIRSLVQEARVEHSFFIQKGKLQSAKNGEYVASKIHQTAQEIAKLPIIWDDNSDLTIADIHKDFQRHFQIHGNYPCMIVIDYLQLMISKDDSLNREQQIASISRDLQKISKKYKCVVIALTQLNRSLERRPDKRPIMSDLRESGSLEQDADVIVMLYRDEVYNKETEDKGIAEILVRKHKTAGTSTLRCRFFDKYARFDNLYEESDTSYSNSNYGGGY